MAATQIDASVLRREIARAAPRLWDELGRLAARWTALALARLERSELPRGPKSFNDPIWGTIELSPWEVLLLDSPLLQRLRGVRQLGMVHQVYHSAGHDRLEHTRGVIEAAERIIQALERNARRRVQYGAERDRDVPLPSDLDRVTLRLAALLHDIGHGPFSHATEALIGERMRGEFAALEDALRRQFPDVTKFAIGEMIAIVLVMSEALRSIFEHPRFGATNTPTRLAPAIVSHILGSRLCLDAPYLSGIISGPLDADKLDYMARDSYHAGLPVALDTNRLINKLEVVAITPENVTNPTLRDRAAATPGRRYYDIGISVAGLGAYEQMIVGRVILYDRLYYHHKVRAAEAMVRKLIEVAEHERGRQFVLEELFFNLEDDGMIDLFAGRLRADGFEGGNERARSLGATVRERQLYHRAYAVAKRFISGFEGLDAERQEQNRIYRWNILLEDLSSAEACRELERTIFETARRIDGELPGEFAPEGEEIREEHIVLDIPFNKSVVRGSDILTRTEDGHLSTPNLFFDPERWSNAYKEQKQCGYIFTPRVWVPLVSLASRLVFFERFRVVMNDDADRLAKTSGYPFSDWIRRLAEKGACSVECKEALAGPRPRFVPIREDEVRRALPESWLDSNPDLAREVAEGFESCLPDGVLVEAHGALLQTIGDLAACISSLEEGGAFAKAPKLDEKRELQVRIRDCLRNRGVAVREGTEIAGGETDLVARDLIVIENKVAHQPVKDPFGSGPHYAWQARRYTIPISQTVCIVILAYRPTDEASVLPLGRRIRVMPPGSGPQDVAQVRMVIPFGHGVPHDAKAPPSG